MYGHIQQQTALFYSNSLVNCLQSLMIAAIPNIIGWLAISFAKVRQHMIPEIVFNIAASDNMSLMPIVVYTGLFLFVHGTIA
jgi:hypothetical protein